MITCGEVRKHLLDLDVTRNIGPNGISPWIRKEGAKTLWLPHFMVYNKSLVTGELLKIWKTTIEVPIFKKGDRLETLNYRPLSCSGICTPVD